MQIKTKQALLTSFILWILSALIIFLIILQSTHSLDSMTDWFSLKKESTVCYTIMGTHEFNEGRQVFYRNALHLEPWYGFNEVAWNKQLDWTDLNFDYELTNGSYLWVFFAQTKEKRFAVRLSASPLFESGYFELNQDGKILTKIPFLQSEFPSQKQQFRVTLDDRKISFFNNDVYLRSTGLPELSEQFLSFRSGSLNASVDNIILKKNGLLTAAENFSPAFSIAIFLIAIALMFFLLDIFILFAVVITRSLRFNVIIRPIILFQVFSIIVLVTYLAFDYYYWSKLFHFQTGDQNIIINPKLSHAENIRKRTFDFFNLLTYRIPYPHKHLDPKIISFHKLKAEKEDCRVKNFQYINALGQATESDSVEKMPPSHFKIAFMGTSQTWGEGARNIDEKFTTQTIKKLNEKYGVTATALNFSIKGSTSSILLDVYKNVLKKNTPDLLVINLSHNDSDQKLFAENLEKIVELNKHKNIKTIFIQEANSVETQPHRLLTHHGTMVSIAKRNQIPVIPLHNYIKSKEIYDSGLIWWDYIHLASHGHNIVSDWLAQNLADFTKGKLSPPK